MGATALLFSDFNCPFCYAMGERIEAAGFSERVDWRGVQHAPHLPQPMAPAIPGLALELEQEVEAVRRLSPQVLISLPRGKPNTLPAIRATAAAMGVDRQLAHQFELRLYRDFWQRGADISKPEVLSETAKACGLPELRITPEAEQTATSWQRAWELSGARGVPTLIREDGHRLVGLAKLEDLKKFLA